MPTAKRRLYGHSSFLGSRQIIAINCRERRDHSRTGEFSFQRLMFESSEGCGRLGNGLATISEGGLKSRLVSAIGHIENSYQ
jgi:hypothetical protein